MFDIETLSQIRIMLSLLLLDVWVGLFYEFELDSSIKNQDSRKKLHLLFASILRNIFSEFYYWNPKFLGVIPPEAAGLLFVVSKFTDFLILL
jgi:hypothetical protein